MKIILLILSSIIICGCASNKPINLYSWSITESKGSLREVSYINIKWKDQSIGIVSSSLKRCFDIKENVLFLSLVDKNIGREMSLGPYKPVITNEGKYTLADSLGITSSFGEYKTIEELAEVLVDKCLLVTDKWIVNHNS